jgi:hypothetical protein
LNSSALMACLRPAGAGAHAGSAARSPRSPWAALAARPRAPRRRGRNFRNRRFAKELRAQKRNRGAAQPLRRDLLATARMPHACSRTAHTQKPHTPLAFRSTLTERAPHRS